jgi:PPK2 family polyphosphate:nucleotide phosphotransferase
MDRYRITTGKGFRLADWDPDDTSAVKGAKPEARAELAELRSRLDELQEKLYADGRHRVLVVLQGMDTSGKSGTIRRVFEGVDPSGVRAEAFKAPTPTELEHDFLWRVHPHVPGNGEVVIFDRSHYEDVLIVRVHDLVPAKRWKARYRHIREFERTLIDEGTTILKFFLHISSNEQRARLQARLDDPAKHWKFRLADLDERKRWDDYMAAFGDALSRCSTEWAPWYVIPSDRKWFRNLSVARILADTLESLDPQYPQPEDLPTELVIE